MYLNYLLSRLSWYDSVFVFPCKPGANFSSVLNHVKPFFCAHTTAALLSISHRFHSQPTRRLAAAAQQQQQVSSPID